MSARLRFSRRRASWLLALILLACPAALFAQDSTDTGETDWIWPVLAAGVVAGSAAVPFARTRLLRTVFLSYRRSDSPDETTLVSGRVAGRFGRRRVFHDVRSLRPGEPFRDAIARVLRTCDAAIVLIGPDWTSCKDDQGRLRLHEAEDVVRAEVGAAIDSGALVIPVLVRGASPPRTADLPPDLWRLADLQMVRLDPALVEDSLAATLHEIATAPVRATPLMLVAAHLSAAILPLVFYQGLLVEEFTTSMAIVLPGLVASAAVAVVSAVRGLKPARVRRIKTRDLFVPIVFAAAIGTLVLLKAFNIGFRSFEPFKLALAGVELAFVAYTAVALSSLFENRSGQ